MIEEKKKKKPKERLIINIIDDVPCIYLQPGIIRRKLPPPQIIPFHFTTIQEVRTNDVMPDVLKELTKLFSRNPWGISYFKLDKMKEEEEEDDNEE